MSRVFITGSSDGLGQLAARMLLESGHQVTLHARNKSRADDARRAVAAADTVLIGDLSSIDETRRLADEVNALGRHEAVIHNAGVGSRSGREATVDGLSLVFAVNVLAPYLLTALIARPDRLVYVSSGMHMAGDPGLDDPRWQTRNWNGTQAYSDSKLFLVMLAFAVARRWRNVLSNAIEPGWVPTKMGGPAAPDDLALGAATQVWLAVSNDPSAKVSGHCFYHQREQRVHTAARRSDLQERLLDYCAKISGVALPP